MKTHNKKLKQLKGYIILYSRSGKPRFCGKGRGGNIFEIFTKKFDTFYPGLNKIRKVLITIL